MAPWNAMPLTNVIIRILKKRHGVILDDELKRTLKKDTGTQPSDAELNEALLHLEINGLIHVSQITKTKRKIEIIDESTEFLAVDED